MCPPQSVSDYSAAAQVLDLEAQVMVPIICLKQRVVGVWAKELERDTHIYHSEIIQTHFQYTHTTNDI